VLPVAYATYYWDGVPYYYANNAYYTWSPDYSGYVATDPPPLTDPSGSAGAQAPPGSADEGTMQAAPEGAPPGSGTGDDTPPMAGAGAAPGGASSGPAVEAGPPGSEIYMYPKNGQTPEQQSADKQECERWASDQVGVGSNGPDYRRAMIACIEGRGYSVQ
jgi:hypothetical protein